MLRLAEIYVLTGMALGLGLACAAAFGLTFRRLLIACAACVAGALLIPVAARYSPVSIGLPLTGGAVMLGGFLCALRLVRRGRRSGPRVWVWLTAGGIAAYAAAGVLLPMFWPSAVRSDVFIYQQALIVLALPMLLGAAFGLWVARPRFAAK